MHFCGFSLIHSFITFFFLSTWGVIFFHKKLCPDIRSICNLIQVFQTKPFFALQFAFSIDLIHGSGRAVKNGEGLGNTYHVNDVWGECRGPGACKPKNKKKTGKAWGTRLPKSDQPSNREQRTILQIDSFNVFKGLN